MTDVYEFSEFDRSSLIYNFATLTPEESAEKQENFRIHAESKAKPVQPNTAS